MERWNELVAGYVLGNLTDGESQELAQLMTEKPQLTEEIARLRKTATIRGASPAAGQPLGLVDQFPRSESGEEGWADENTRLPNPALLKTHHVLKPPAATLTDASPMALLISVPAYFLTSFRQRFALPDLTQEPMGFPMTNPWWCLLVLLLIGVGVDNWRVRRSLAISQEKLAQLEDSQALPLPLD
ncbi:MAG: hypothetical protein AAGC93_12195 [Cyanobacteria bacterium P01_F01_bin.53]